MVLSSLTIGATASCIRLCPKPAVRQNHAGSARTLAANLGRCNKLIRLHPKRDIHISHSLKQTAARAAGAKAERDAERDLFLSVLSATTTKRDAKSYLSRFRPTTSKTKLSNTSQDASSWPINVALIKIRAVQTLDETLVQGIAHTLSQLSRLGLSPVVVVDCEAQEDADEQHEKPGWREELTQQVDRMVLALQGETASRALRLDYVLGISEPSSGNMVATIAQPEVQVQHPEALIAMLRKNHIPVIPPIAYTLATQKVEKVEADEVMLAITRHFMDSKRQEEPPDGKSGIERKSSQTQATIIALDRIVLLDPLGGLPSAQRCDSAHVFINLEQEYRDVRQELLGAHASVPSNAAESLEPSARLDKAFELPPDVRKTSAPPTNRNVKNLDLLQKALALLPPTASAMLTTPAEAATSNESPRSTNTDLGVITRRPKNPLIYNLLTDKALVSSSLPAARLDISVLAGAPLTRQPLGATFVKRGMPVTMIPDPRYQVWEPPHPSRAPLRLDDPKIDLPRLINLIEDSFNRPLNIEHYMNRIRNNLAGIIVAGEYEGGAILTWELPPGVPDDGSEESRQRMVPYLDKFAVLKRSQGAGGVADIVFSAMVRSCFPRGVSWRSRKDNPVNKWYFERSVGTYKIPETNWTTFWTTEGLYEDKQKFRDYVDVSRAVQPSWADLNKHAAD